MKNIFEKFSLLPFQDKNFLNNLLEKKEQFFFIVCSTTLDTWSFTTYQGTYWQNFSHQFSAPQGLPTSPTMLTSAFLSRKRMRYGLAQTCAKFVAAHHSVAVDQMGAEKTATLLSRCRNWCYRLFWLLRQNAFISEIRGVSWVHVKIG